MKTLKWEYEIEAKKGQYVLFVRNRRDKWFWKVLDAKRGFRCVASGSTLRMATAMSKAEIAVRDLKLFPRLR